MAGYDRILDPVTGDYVDDGAGGYEETSGIEPAVYHLLKGQRGLWWGDAEAGSDLYLVKQKGAGVAGRAFAANAIQSALQPLVDDGLADDLAVTVEVQDGRVVALVEMTDLQTGTPVTFTAPIGEK